MEPNLVKLRERYWSLQDEMEELSQAEYEGRKGQKLLEKQQAVDDEAEKLLGFAWYEKPGFRRYDS